MDGLSKRLKQTATLVQRAYKIYVSPPAETNKFLRPEEVRIIAFERNHIEIAEQPKQVISVNSLAYVSCMRGHSIQVFDLNHSLQKVDEIYFEDECIELTHFGKYLFATTTNFAKPPQALRNRLWAIDLDTHQIISSVDTGGNWSKVIAIHSSGKFAFVSNWQSNNISVISISDINNPVLIDVFAPFGGQAELKAPRGIAFTDDGNVGLVTGFYSRNLLEIRQEMDNKFHFSYVGEPFMMGGYGGNPRDIVIPNGKDVAFYSNLGTNTIHAWSIPDRRVIATTKVGKQPNSIALYGENEELLLVSCRASRSVYILDTATLNVIGRSELTGKKPTGLATTGSGFLVSDFDSNGLGEYSFTPGS